MLRRQRSMRTLTRRSNFSFVLISTKTTVSSCYHRIIKIVQIIINVVGDDALVRKIHRRERRIYAFARGLKYSIAGARLRWGETQGNGVPQLIFQTF